MRKGEQFSVTWDQVDFKQGFIYLSMTKNGSERYVHLNQTCHDTLLALKEDCRSRGLIFQTLFYDKQNTPIKDPSEWFEVS